MDRVRFRRLEPPDLAWYLATEEWRERALAALFDGLDWRRMYAPRVPRPKVAG